MTLFSRTRPALVALPLLIAFPCLVGLLVGCGGSEAPPAGSGGTAGNAPANAGGPGVSSQEATTIFESLCSTCHGTKGHGDGPGAGALDPKPRSFADVAWQDSVDDEHIRKVIVFGGGGVGKSLLMPPQPQLKGKTETLNALVKIVRGFRGK